MNITWKDIGPPFSNYAVSNDGHIRNKTTSYVFNNNNTIGGYIKVSLINDNGQQRYKLMHRLVAEAFFGQDDGSVVHHIDGNRQNNNCENLQWMSQKKNVQLIESRVTTKSRPVDQFDLNVNFIRRWDRIKDVHYGKSNISSCCAGKIPSAYGYIWRYAETTIENEIWKSVIFNERTIGISDKGRVRLPSGKVTYGNLTANNYRNVTISGKSAFVHRLVAKYFIQGFDDNFVVNHKDYNKQNNNAENLEWISQQENSMHGRLNQTYNPRKCRVVRTSNDGETKTYDSFKDAANDTKISKGNICMVCKGQRTSAGGFKWQYAV